MAKKVVPGCVILPPTAFETYDNFLAISVIISLGSIQSMRNDLTLRKAAQSGVGEVEGTTLGSFA